MKIAGQALVGRELIVGSKRINVDLIGVECEEVVSLVGGKLDSELHYDVTAFSVFHSRGISAFACVVYHSTLQVRFIYSYILLKTS